MIHCGELPGIDTFCYFIRRNNISTKSNEKKRTIHRSWFIFCYYAERHLFLRRKIVKCSYMLGSLAAKTSAILLCRALNGF